MADEPVSAAPSQSAKAAAKRAATHQKPAASWLIPLVTAAILAGAFCLYYFVYVAAQREYLANRNFRALAVLGAQVQEVVSIHGSILEFAADLADPKRKHTHRQRKDLNQFLVVRSEDTSLPPKEKEEETRKDYLNYLSPSFELTEVPLEKRRAPAQQTSRPAEQTSRFDVRRRNGHWELVLTAQRHKGAENDYSGSLEIDGMVEPFVKSLPFDDILLVSEKGLIVYQTNKAGPQFTTLSALLQAQPSDGKTDPAAGAPAGEGSKNIGGASVAQNADPIWRSKSKHLTDVTLAGTSYKLFLQPILVDVFSDEPGESEPAREWVICGLKSARGLDWEALSISPTFIIWFVALFLVVLLSGPILKVVFMNKRERFRLRELGFVGLSLVLLTGVLTFSGLETLVFSRNDNTEERLRRLGEKLSGNIHVELQQMRDQLQEWCSKELPKDGSKGTERGRAKGRGSEKNLVLRQDLTLAQDREVIRNSPSPGDRPRPKNTITPGATKYAYVNNAFWTDDDGNQIVKWSTSGYLTPMIDISGLRLYTHPKSIYLDGKEPPFYFDSLRPPNKLEYLAGLAMTTGDCNPALLPGMRRDVAGGSAFLTAQPLSLIDPILPFDYGFALLDESGSVLFHSDKTKNLHENFLQESEESRQLYAAAFGHSNKGSLTLKYLGRDYEALVSPIPGLSQAPWSLIVYRDLTSVRTLNLQATTMVSSLLLLVLAVPVLTIALWCVLRRPRFAPEWLWPNPARMRTYLSQCVIYAALIILFLFLGFTGPVELNVIACVLVPPAAFLLTLSCYRAFPPLQANERTRASNTPPAGTAGNSSYSWRKVYVLSIVLLLLLTGVLVPMSLFRASLSVERRLAVKQAQLHLASALGQRLMSTREGCENGKLGKAACDEFQNPRSDIWGKIVFDPLFPEDGRLKVSPHAVPLGGTELYSGWLQGLVYTLHHDYNNGAAEMLSMIPDRALPAPGNDWAWENDGSTTTLRWHGVHLPAQTKGELENDLLIPSTLEPPSTWIAGLGGAAVACWVIFAMGLLVWILVRRVFLFHIAPATRTAAQRAIEMIREGKNVVILLPPAVSDLKLDIPTFPMDLHHWATGPQWVDDLDLDKVIPVNLLVEIQNFEYTMNDAEIDNQKFILIDRLKALKNTQFVVEMRVPASTEDYRRMFEGIEVIDLREEPFLWLKEYEGQARDLIWKECGPLSALWPLGAQLAKDIRPDEEHLEETVVTEMLDRAEPYYRLLWRECSKDQKFALTQLAEDGLPNPTNGRALRHLATKNLIIEDPQFRIMNESFRRFLLSHISVDLKREWMREARRTGWGRMHGAFFTTMLLLGAFLLTTQNELWQSSAAYVTTALGALGTFTKLFNTFRGGGSPAPVTEKAD